LLKETHVPQLIEPAVAKAAQLPEEDQDAIASILLQLVESEQR
jgi:hypothetical protein